MKARIALVVAIAVATAIAAATFSTHSRLVFALLVGTGAGYIASQVIIAAAEAPQLACA
jgi:hypothetical protein